MSIAIIIAVALVIAVVLVALGRRSAGGAVRRKQAHEAMEERYPELHLSPADFTVDGDTAVVSFDVELLPGDVDPALRDLLLRRAVEVVRDKIERGLPLAGVSSVKALGHRGDIAVEAGSVEFAETGTVEDAGEAESDQGGTSEGVVEEGEVDPLRTLGDREFAANLVAPAVRSGEGFPPLHEAIQLTARLVSVLADRGIEPESMSIGQMTFGLLGAAGYEVVPVPEAQAYVARRSGSTTFVAIVAHEEGDHPELSETAINSFLARFYSSRAERGLLLSDKFGPHMVYEKERRDTRVTFITRERLQDFVDSIAVATA